MGCVVEAMGLVKAFGGRRVVDGVSFSAGVGFTALMGPNGAGKTTTLSMVVGALRPDGGSVRVCGFDMWGRDGLRARRLLGYAPQDMPFKEKLSGYENLVWIGLPTSSPPWVPPGRVIGSPHRSGFHPSFGGRSGRPEFPPCRMPGGDPPGVKPCENERGDLYC